MPLAHKKLPSLVGRMITSIRLPAMSRPIGFVATLKHRTHVIENVRLQVTPDLGTGRVSFGDGGDVPPPLQPRACRTQNGVGRTQRGCRLRASVCQPAQPQARVVLSEKRAF